jgi:sarcosine oxidase gamma subunit
MMEPALVDVDGGRVFLTVAGHAARSVALTGEHR